MTAAIALTIAAVFAFAVFTRIAYFVFMDL